MMLDRWAWPIYRADIPLDPPYKGDLSWCWFRGLTIAAIALVPVYAADVTFEADVYPILQKKCSGCHFPGTEKVKSKLDLSTAATMLAGGESGVSILPGNARESKLIRMLEWKAEPHMPPPEKFEQLKPEQIEVIRLWIEGGAKSSGAPVALPTSPPGAHGQDAHATTGVAPIASQAFATVNGELLLARGQLHTVEVFVVDSVTGLSTAKATLAGHAETVRGLAFSPDGALLAAAGGLPGRAGEVKVWKTADWTLLRTLDGHKDNILDVAFSPDGKSLATSSYDRMIAIWDVAAGTQRMLLENHVDAVYTLDYSPDGKMIASGAGDRTVKIWDAATGMLLLTISDSLDTVNSIAFSPSGKFLAGAGADKSIRVWRMDTGGEPIQQSGSTAGQLAASTFAHDGPILKIVYSPDEKTIYSTGEDQRIKAWDAATLAEGIVFEPQADWVSALALSPDGALLAAGRYDASSALYAAATGKPLDGTTTVAAVETDKGKKPRPLAVPPVILRATVPPSFGSMSPDRAPKGTEVEVTVDGKNLDKAEVVVSDGRIKAEILSVEPGPEVDLDFDDGKRGTAGEIIDNARPYKLKLKLTIAADIAVGRHEILFRTPTGLSNGQSFTVADQADGGETEPNDTVETAQALAWPTIMVGQFNIAGDVDRYKVAAKAGDEIVFVLTDTTISPAMKAFDGAGIVIATNADHGPKSRMFLGFKTATDGDYVLQIEDKELRAGLYYRLNVGRFPFVTEVSPLGVPAGIATDVHAKGFNLGGTEVLRVTPPETADVTTRAELPVSYAEWNPVPVPRVAVGPFPEAFEAEPNNDPASAMTVAFPSTTNGQIDSSVAGGDSDVYRFAATKGETYVIETLASRLGVGLDSLIEILDTSGKPLELGVVRSVAQTHLALNGRDSRSGGFRLDSWRDIKMNDYMMMGSEIIMVDDLPDYGDEDVGFATYANGQRKTFFGTTPEHHAVDSKAYKVEVHPPGTAFATNGMPVHTLLWRNDDGFLGEADGGGDSRLDFVAPADGNYLVRVTDALGAGGDGGAYRLMVRPLKPDFSLRGVGRLNISRGSKKTVEVSVQRKDGFDGPVKVQIVGLPAGFTTQPDTVLAGEEDVRIPIFAGSDAQSTFVEASFVISAEAELDGKPVVRENRIGAITVSEMPPDLVVNNGELEVAIAPGQSGKISVKLDRANGFDGRVPIDVLNLPYGVRVMDTGLNGILVREGEYERGMELYVEPWVTAIDRPIYIQARIETPSATNPVFVGDPIRLKIAPDAAMVAKEKAE